MRKALTVSSAAFLLLTVSYASSKEPAGQVVDTGSFGVFVNGQRVATETFSIQQTSGGSTVKSQLKEEGSADKATQTSQMQLTAGGELIRYEWQELSPSKTQIELVPNEQFLTERITLNPDCGFAPGSAAKVSIDEVYQKLKNEVEAARRLRAL